ncbi:GTP pyrophosphokinase family protein [Corynebacterium liangguodongii]|uniref:GTP pyrophosphokinase n=1 Tax=Corynebacterium liangguodongii TaxID=2079535 RepID=A0A2S0WEW4_9CORY|nr:GTP pyrophosphokinase [Corynebacterium liangguodongii]AWB84327.1 GTP pyrophosphokinase [Corynebacterium liangguodongii]PWB99817.1 GTP pyrophosphokinase [Corynebacterium liangguodongii]
MNSANPPRGASGSSRRRPSTQAERAVARLGSTYHEWVAAHPDAATAFQQALVELIGDAGVNYDRVDVRIKTWPSLKAKAKKLRDGEPVYPDPWHDIRDIIGARITVLHSTEIPAVLTLLADEFEVLRSVDKAQETRVAGGFGYGSHHVVLRVTESSENLEAYVGTQFEVQVRTVLQHAWAEFEHDIRYKRSGEDPDPQIDRAFTLAAGLIELADQQFDQIASINNPRHAVDTGVDADLAAETLPGVLTVLLGSRFPLSRPSDYRFLMELLRAHDIETVMQLAELCNVSSPETVGHAMDYAFVPGQVRIIDDLLLNHFGSTHIERTAELGNRPKLRRSRLESRLAALRARRTQG